MIFESQCQETGVDVPVSEQVSSNNSFGTPLQGGQRRGIKMLDNSLLLSQKKPVNAPKRNPVDSFSNFLRPAKKFNSYKQLLGGRTILINLGSF